MERLPLLDEDPGEADEPELPKSMLAVVVTTMVASINVPRMSATTPSSNIGAILRTCLELRATAGATMFSAFQTGEALHECGEVRLRHDLTTDANR